MRRTIPAAARVGLRSPGSWLARAVVRWAWTSWSVSAAAHAVGLTILACVVVGAGGPARRFADLTITPSDPQATDSALITLPEIALALAAPAEVVQSPQPTSPIATLDAPTLDLLSDQRSLAATGPGDFLSDGLAGSLTGLGQESAEAVRGAKFYDAYAPGDQFVYVVDCSGSMEGRRFRRARKELQRSLDALVPTQKFFVIFFSDGAYEMPAPGPVFATDEHKKQVNKWIESFRASGETYPWSALRLALEFQPDAVFFLTDGKFDPSVVNLVAHASRVRTIPVHAIAFMSKEGESLLTAIAQVSTGTYKFVR